METEKYKFDFFKLSVSFLIALKKIYSSIRYYQIVLYDRIVKLIMTLNVKILYILNSFSHFSN